MSSSKASRTAGFPPVALVEGDESTLRAAALVDLRERTLEQGPRDFNEDRFDLAAGVAPGRISDAARIHPIMAPGRLVLVRGVGDRRAARFLDKELDAYLDDPSPSTCLVLEADEVDRRLKWVKRVAKLGEHVRCSGPTRPAEVRSWIDARLRQLGKQPGAGTAAALFELVGADLDRLSLELEKLVLYAADAEQIDPEHVAAVTGQLRPRALYELTDLIGRRQLGRALGVLAQLLDQGEAPLAVLGALANHFRRLVRARECQPLEAHAVQERLSIHPYAARKLAEQAQRFDQRRLRYCLDAVRRTDGALKGALPLDPRQAVERLVLVVCA